MSNTDEQIHETDNFQDALDDQSGVSSTVVPEENAQDASSVTTSPSKKKNKKKKKKKNGVDASGSEADLNQEEEVNNYGEKEQKEDDLAEEKAGQVDDIDVREPETELIEEPIEEVSKESVEEPTTVSNETSELSEPPLSKSTEHYDEDSQSLQEENKKLEEQLKEFSLIDKQEKEEEEETAESLEPNPIQPPAIPRRAPPPGSPEKTPSSATTSVAAPPPLPQRDTLSPPPIPERDTSLPPPLPGREHVAQSAPPLPQRQENEELLKPFKNKAISADDFVPPPLPPQLTQAQKSQHRPSSGFAGGIGSWFNRGSFSKDSNTDLSESSIDYDENYDLLLNRLTENNEEYLSKEGLQREQLDTSLNELKSSFNEKISEIETTVGGADETISTTGNDSELSKVDWPFWTKVFNDYASVAKAEPSKLSKEIAKGIPKQIRSIVWQLVSNSNPQQFEEKFKELETQESPNEKSIQKDLTRTSYISDYGIKTESLHKVISVYSLVDTEVGYTQGMAFIVAPLLLDSTELDAFALFHKLMYGYNLRSLFLPEMPGLLLSLYQFDRLVEDTLPNLHTHFLRQGVRSSMYATQWFLTFFAYKFPLEFVLRIFDIVITEGFESILKFAIALVSKNEEKLLTLKFDKLIEYLKENLFTAYLIEPEMEQDDEENQQTLKSNLGDFFKFNQGKPITVDAYDVNQFIEDATNVKLLPITLRRYEEEFEQIHQQEKERREEVDELKSKNHQLRRDIKKIETSYTILNREHVQIANEIISNRIKVETLEDEVKDLKSQNQSLRERILSIQKQEVEVPANFESDLKNAMDRNLEVMTKNQELEDQVGTLLQEIEDLKSQQQLQKAKPVEEIEDPREQHGSKGWTKKFFK